MLTERIASEYAQLTDPVDPHGAAVHPQDVLALQRQRMFPHLGRGHPARRQGPDQGADARADDPLGADSRLRETAAILLSLVTRPDEF